MESDSNFEPEPEEIEEINKEDHTGKNKHECDFPGCKATFSKPSRLETHLNIHSNKRPHKCKHEGCDKAYTNQSHLKRHMQSHSVAAKTYTCHVCSAKISTLSNLKRHHNRAHNIDRELHCTECNVKFRKKCRYEEHMEAHTNSLLYKCDTCEQMFVSHRKMLKHQRSHKANKKYECPIENCTEVFEKWMALVKHKKTDHVNISIKHPCTKCNKEFATRAHLKVHSRVHLEERPAIPCPYDKCNRLYYFRRNLDMHIRIKHNGQKYLCDICGRALSSKQKIENHIISMHFSEKKPFKRKVQAPRKDIGQAKKSTLSLLTGIHLSVNAEVKIMQRNPVALLRDRIVEESVSEDDKVSDTSVKGA